MRTSVLTAAGLRICGLLLLLALGACRHGVHQRGAPAPAPYLRVHDAGDGTLELQVAVRRLEAPGQPPIWLVGASHLGDTNYFDQLQQLLDAQGLVLFEGIGGTPSKPQPGEERESSLQTALAESVGLVFQLDAIEYHRRNFRNCDMSVAQLMRVMAAAAENGDTSELDGLLALMSGSSFWSKAAQWGLRWIGSSEKLRAITRLMLVEALGQLEGDLSQLDGLPDEMKTLFRVIIQERNQVVIAELKRRLAAKLPPKSLAVFYGAGHMDHLERRLAEELNYRPAENRWLTAFSVNPRKAGLTEAEIALAHSLVAWQMDGLKGDAVSPGQPKQR